MRATTPRALVAIVAATIVLATSMGQVHTVAAPAAAVSAQDAGGSGNGGVRADFNGDGVADLAIGIPHEDTPNGPSNSGAVVVVYGGADGLTGDTPGTPAPQFWSQGTTGVPGSNETGDYFGSSLAAGDFNADGYSDLAVGVPGEDITTSGSTVKDMGGVVVIYGSAGGLTTSDPAVPPTRYFDFTQGSVPMDDGTGSALGSSLAAGDFDGDGDDDLAAGAPGFSELIFSGAFRQYQRYEKSGVVWVLQGTAGSGLTLAGDRLWSYQDIFFTPVAGLELGTALAAGDFNHDGCADLAIGIPSGDTYDTGPDGPIQPLWTWYDVVLVDSGHVLTIAGSPGGLTTAHWDVLHQDGSDRLDDGSVVEILGVSRSGDRFGASLAVGDFNGDGFSDLAIGVPGEDRGGRADVGAVNVLYGSPDRLNAVRNQLWYQDTIFGNAVTPYYGSTSEPGDQFGLALAAGDFDGDGRADLAVGVPLEDVLVDTGTSLVTVPDAGEVDVIYGSAAGLSVTVRAPQNFHQATINIEGDPEAGDRFGFSLTAGNFGRNGFDRSIPATLRYDDLAIGVPYEDVSGVLNAGAVSVIYGSATALTWSRDQLWTQASPGVPGGPEVADHFGWAVR